MCMIEFRLSGVLEIFPSIHSDDVSAVRLQDVEVGEQMEIEVVDMSDDAVTVCIPFGGSTTIPLEGFRVLKACEFCTG